MKKTFKGILLLTIYFTFMTLNSFAQEQAECPCRKVKFKKDSIFYYKKLPFNSTCYKLIDFDGNSSTFKFIKYRTFEDGTLIIEKKYDNNTNKLITELVYEDGTLIIEKKYDNNTNKLITEIVYSNKQRNSIQKKWDTKGRLESILSYENGKKNNSLYYTYNFAKQDHISKIEKYEKGKLIEIEKYNYNYNDILKIKVYKIIEGEEKLVKSKEYNKNGEITYYKSYNKDGEYDGKYCDVYNNKETIGSYKNGEKIGIWLIRLHTDTTIILEKNIYKDGNNIYFASWNKDGIKTKEIVKKDGKIISNILWNNSGQKTGETFYKDGKIISNISWNNSGQKIGEAFYKDGQIISNISWNNNGQKTGETFYKDGKFAYKILWNNNGGKIEETFYKDGEKYYNISWNDNNIKTKEIIFINNKKIITYYYDAQIEVQLKKINSNEKQILTHVKCKTCPKQVLTSFITNIRNNDFSTSEKYLSKYVLGNNNDNKEYEYKSITGTKVLMWGRLKNSKRTVHKFDSWLKDKLKWQIWFPRKDIAIINKNSDSSIGISFIYQDGKWLIFGIDDGVYNPTDIYKFYYKVKDEYRLSNDVLKKLAKEYTSSQLTSNEIIPTITAKTSNDKFYDWGSMPIESDDGPADGWTWHCNMVCPPDDINISASTSLISNENNKYSAQNIADDNPHTAWVEGSKGYGKNDYILIKDWALCSDQEIWILNGYQLDKNTWENNSRVKKLRVTIDNKDICYVILADKMGKQEINLPIKVNKASTFKFTIIEVYPGKKYKDTAISGIFNCGG